MPRNSGKEFVETQRICLPRIKFVMKIFLLLNIFLGLYYVKLKKNT